MTLYDIVRASSGIGLPTIKKLLGELLHAESEKEFMLKSILQRLIGHLCEHHSKWRQLERMEYVTQIMVLFLGGAITSCKLSLVQ
jgi:hypothetical protein